MRTLALALALALVPASPTRAQGLAGDAGVGDAGGMDGGVETDIGSSYLFRGIVYGDGPVAQSTAWLSLSGFSVYVWNNVAVAAPLGSRWLDEVDVGVSYAIERGALTIQPGFDVYLYRLSDAEAADDEPSGTAEASVTVSYTRGAVAVSTRQVLDAASYRGAYFGELNLGYTRGVGADLEIGMTGRIGWASAHFNREYLEVERAAVGLAGAGLSVTRRLGRHAYIRPHVEVTGVPHRALRADRRRSVNTVVGVAFGVAR